ncbi:lytic transglycosylase domain-containing protein [Pseudoruegeria sp. HB172150]|uniref:lytic transglycosylase domain-containing protein n=1 Tax=Pseudoruegeria sp. HB172150 TaxID=2721164 RepID=UPI001551B9B5|nr:lytic transglycosylase domain-containing protein [Pseudoruegeria sp. HB172150]
MRGIAVCVIALALYAPAVVAQPDMRPLPRPETRSVAEATVDAEGGVAAELEEAAVSDLAVAVMNRLPAPRPTDLMSGQELRLALAAASGGDWELAARTAAAGGRVTADIIEWQRLRAGKGNFADYRAFLARNGDWPGLKYLRLRGEGEIPAGAAAADVIGYFEPEPPQTGRGALRLAQAYSASGQAEKANAEALRAWLELEMSAVEEEALVAAFGSHLKGHHAERLDMLLWRKDRNGTLRAMARVDPGHKALAEARVALQREDAGVDALIEKVPASLRNDGGLAYDRAIWRIEKGRRDSAGDLMIEQSTSAEALGRPEEWAYWRRVLARQEMRGGNAKRAYQLASRHFMPATTDGFDYADLEWLSGYLALRYLKDAELALSHFKKFTEAVSTPISLGRGYYWEGRALSALGNDEAAQEAYHKGGAHQTSFYGLLSAEKAGLPMDPSLTGRDPAPDWREAGFTKSSVFQAARLFFGAGEQWETIRFLSHLAEITPQDELVQLTDFALSLGDPYIAVRVAKQAASEGVVAPRAYYPLAGLGGKINVEEALALSIARRESEFNIGAVSPVGARGLMQLMPGTAKQMSARAGLSYTPAKLTTDPVYNTTLGSAYLEELIEEFGKNYVLVAVGYNAGPSRARSWINLFGDPRYSGTDPVDWIEHIPFNETQTYVMRVTESLPIYRARLTGEVQPIRLLAELGGR